jgi:signal transduction histidine kinase
VLLLFLVIIFLAFQVLLSLYLTTRSQAALSGTAAQIVDSLDGNTMEGLLALEETGESGERVLSQAAMNNNFQVLILEHGVERFNSVQNSALSLITKAVAGSDRWGEFLVKYDNGKEPHVEYYVYERAVGSFTIEVRTPMQVLVQGAGYVNRFIIWVLLLALLFALMLAFLFSRQFAKPLIKINNTAKCIAALNFDSRIITYRKDEIGELAASVNEMSDKLKNAIDELRANNEQLQRELARERETDTMRKKFVADVSHELKTPLAIIQGYCEALSMNVTKSDEKRRYYCDIITDETKRMNKLVLDLLDLSQVQSGTYKLDRVDLEIDKLLAGIAGKQREIMASRGIHFTSHAAPARVFADSGRLEQVVNNYLSNAAAHASGKFNVRLTGEAAPDGRYTVTVFNTGPCIPDEQLDKIWDAFYKADVSRTRDEGRHGIGLSIVKALLDRHGAEYGVRNVAGGVEFYFTVNTLEDGDAGASGEQARPQAEAPSGDTRD